MFFKDYFRFLEQFKTRGEVGRTYCSPKLELKLKGSLDQNFKKISKGIQGFKLSCDF